MSLEFKDNHVTEGLANLLEQFKGKANMEAFLTAFLDEIQDLEDALETVASISDIDASSGDQLDVLGIIVGQPREGRTDAIYRLWIKARVLINRSSGTAPEIMQVLRLITGLDLSEVSVTDLFPAAFIAWTLAPHSLDVNAIYDIINEMRGAGISFNYGYQPGVGDFFRFTDVGGDSGVSFSDVAGADGGLFTGIV